MKDRFEPLYSIGEAAKRLGVVVPLLRNLEKAGIVLSARNEYGKRLYSECDLDYIQTLINASNLREMELEEVYRHLAGQRCWELVKCEPSLREACPQYLNLKAPCWLRTDLSEKEKSFRCHDCPVYRAAPEMIVIGH